LPQYAALREIEDKVLELKKENVKVYVICSGITYGQGEEVFYQLFKAAWLQ
jgi:adenylate kinase